MLKTFRESSLSAAYPEFRAVNLHTSMEPFAFRGAFSELCLASVIVNVVHPASIGLVHVWESPVILWPGSNNLHGNWILLEGPRLAEGARMVIRVNIVREFSLGSRGRHPDEEPFTLRKPLQLSATRKISFQDEGLPFLCLSVPVQSLHLNQCILHLFICSTVACTVWIWPLSSVLALLTPLHLVAMRC